MMLMIDVKLLELDKFEEWIPVPDGDFERFGSFESRGSEIVDPPLS